MVRKVKRSEVRNLVKRVFETDKDLYERRQKSDNKTLDGLVDFTMDNIFDGVMDVEVYTYGDEYGFFAMYENLCRSFGIKKEHRDKKDLFWEAVKDVVGDDCLFLVWDDNDRAIRFFEAKGGELLVKDAGAVLYQINLN